VEAKHKVYGFPILAYNKVPASTRKFCTLVLKLHFWHTLTLVSVK